MGVVGEVDPVRLVLLVTPAAEDSEKGVQREIGRRFRQHLTLRADDETRTPEVNTRSGAARVRLMADAIARDDG